MAADAQDTSPGARDDQPHGLGIDTTVPHIARVYDYWLGGKDNITKVVARSPHIDHMADVYALHADYSN